MMHSAVPRCNQLMRERPDATDELASTAAELSEAQIDISTEDERSAAEALVECLLRLSVHPAPAVRAAAATSMSTHPVGVLWERLLRMETSDPDLAVRAAAARAGKAMFTMKPSCIQCGNKEATLYPTANNDPEDTAHLWPMFCGTACAVEYAFDAAREELRAGARHVCMASGLWSGGDAATCADCETMRLLGEGVVVEEPKAPEPPTTRARRRSARRASP